jgi:hypothetical protein
MVRDIRGFMNKMSRSNRREDVSIKQERVLSAWQPRGGSNVHTFIPLVGLSANQRLLERLEAENAQLRGSVVDLMLQLQALRDGAR